LEIRARISLEIAKFKANAKQASGSFSAIAKGAKVSTDKIDGYLDKSAAKRTAQLRRSEAQELESLRTKQKLLAKFELEKVRNTGGIRAGTNVGRPLPIRDITKDNPDKHKFILSEKEKEAAVRLRIKTTRSLTKVYEKNDKQTIKAITSAYKNAEKEKLNLSKARFKKERDLGKTFRNLEKQEQKRYQAWLQKNAQTSRSPRQERRAAKDQAFTQKVSFIMDDEDFTRKMASSRYALYDISRRALAFGAAITGAMAAGVVAAIKFESAFTSVERTAQVSGKAARDLKNEFIDMSTVIPVAFADLTNIATLGAQLGIASNDLGDFTETVARFSAITGISVDTVALSFGRLSSLMKVPASQFENLSSAITYAGISAVATDAEILKMAESIASVSAQSKISAADTIGFATALASLKVRPEEARGVFTRLFRTFDLGVAQGGEKLDDFAKVIGVTSEQAADLFREDSSEFFQQFLYGANAAGTLNATMTSLGITNVRELNVISKLSQNQDVLTKSIQDSNLEFERAAFSSEAYSLVVDDLASKVSMMQNSIEGLSAAFGETLAGPLGFIVEAITNLSEMLRKTNPAVLTVINIIGGLVAGLAVFVASLTMGIAGLLAISLAMKNLKIAGNDATISVGLFRQLIVALIPNAGAATGVMMGFRNSFAAVGTGAKQASVGVTLFSRAMSVAFGPVGIALALLATGYAIFSSLANGAKEAEGAMFEAAGGFDALVTAAQKDAELGSSFTTIVAGATEAKEALDDENETIKEAIDLRDDAIAAISTQVGVMGGQIEATREQRQEQAKLNDELAITNLMLGENVAAMILNALKDYDGKGSNFWTELTEITPGVRGVLNDIGFSAGKMVSEGMTDGGLTAEEYSKSFVTAMQLIGAAVDAQPATLLNLQKGLEDLGFDFTVDEIKKFASEIDVSGTKLRSQTNLLVKGGKATDGFMGSAKEGAEALTEFAVSQEQLGIETDAATEKLEEERKAALDLADDIRNSFKKITAASISEGKVSDALDSFAQDARDTAGELDGVTEAARKNTSNFAAFMSSAVDASLAAGEGVEGAMKRIIGGLDALNNSGVDTSDAFKLIKGALVENLVAVGGEFANMRAEFEREVSLEGMRSVIRAMYATKIATAGSYMEVVMWRAEMEQALGVLDGEFYIVKEIEKVGKAAATAVTPLQKLKNQLESLFKGTNNKLAALNAVESLGSSLKKNGKVFSQWSEEGRDNISSVLDTIDALADKSNGNTQVFANSLGALRAALVKVGVSGEGLKQIDQAIKKNGKSAKVSKNETKQFYAQLANTDNAKRALLEIAEAVGKVQSALSAGLSATFAQGRAIDDVTLGWLDLTDAQDDARKSIESANDAIVEANQSIQEAKDSINELTADSGKLEYQLQIAIKYGDTLRADAIRAQLDTIDTEISAKEKDITDANKAVLASQEEIADANSKLGINSTTRDIIEQNRVLQDMAGKYANVAAFMITTAAPGADLTAIIDKQVEAFKENAIQMGYTQTEAQAVADVLRTELIASMDEIPDNIRTIIEAETDAALTKVQKFAKDANARLDSIKDKTITVTTIEKTVQANSGGSFKGWVRGSVEAATGGLITGPGTGTSDSISARLSNGEFVVKSAAVKHYGPDFFNSLNQMQTPSASMRMGSLAAATSNTVYLSTEDRQLLRSAIDRPVALYTDNTIIAKSANAGNTLLAQRGIR
jgi:TP901 family phage tail tape measure protein